MKLNRKRFLSALALLTMLPARLLAFFVQSHPNLPLPAGFNASPRRGPWLADWRQCPRVPVLESVHPTAQRLILATLRHEILRIRYWGGSTPGGVRYISPGLVFQAGGCGPLFVSGYCHLRRQERVFRVSLVELLATDGDIICLTE
jgi:hypothetical protein